MLQIFEKKEGTILILVIGEILFDIFPDGKRLGGAPFNFAYHLQSMGLPVRLITRVGNDPDGKEILTALRRYHFNLDTVQIDDEHPTGRVEVRLDESGSPTFTIVPDVAYDYIEFLPEDHRPLLEQCSLIYFGSLAQRSARGHKNIQKLIGHRPPLTRCLYDINLRPAGYTETAVVQSLAQTDLLKLSQEELPVLSRILRFDGQAETFMQHLREAFEIDAIALTKGEDGSELLDAKLHVTSAGDKSTRVVDTVGAGDGFASMLAVGYLQGWPPEKILQLASEFAARICEIPGAVPLQETFYQPFKRRLTEENNHDR